MYVFPTGTRKYRDVYFNRFVKNRIGRSGG